MDPQNPTGYAQVVQESMSGSTSVNRELNRAFVYCLERISQLRSYLINGTSHTQTSYYAYDGHGSTRALTEARDAYNKYMELAPDSKAAPDVKKKLDALPLSP